MKTVIVRNKDGNINREEIDTTGLLSVEFGEGMDVLKIAEYGGHLVVESNDGRLVLKPIASNWVMIEVEL